MISSFNLTHVPHPLARHQYKSCHIQTADLDRPLAAICVDGAYYSFFKVADAASVPKIAARLRQRGDAIVLTRTPKGYAIWILELDAQPLRKTLPYRILTTPTHYRYCQIHVPDLEQALNAIAVGTRYYSLFRSVETLQQAQPILEKLRDRGDEVVMTKTPLGYSLWILEADGWAIE